VCKIQWIKMHGETAKLIKIHVWKPFTLNKHTGRPLRCQSQCVYCCTKALSILTRRQVYQLYVHDIKAQFYRPKSCDTLNWKAYVHKWQSKKRGKRKYSVSSLVSLVVLLLSVKLLMLRFFSYSLHLPNTALSRKNRAYINILSRHLQALNFAMVLQLFMICNI